MRLASRNRLRNLGLGVAVAAGWLFAAPQAEAQTLKAERLPNSNFSGPVWVGSPPGDKDRLFVVEQNSGLIRIYRDEAILPDPYLNVRSLLAVGGERGLLGMAFHPDYANNGYFFINYTNTSGDTTVSRYKVSDDDPDIADPNSAEIVLTVDQPFSNHNAGGLGFSPVDGYLYIPLGDGGSANDPGNRSQNTLNMLGKTLRIDVDELPYGIPPDNPFIGNPKVLDEIWAIGLRNPWRWSFDRETGDMYIGDVGQNAREEVDFEAAGQGGLNYGWRCMEGTSCTGLSGCTCNAPELTLPIHEYSHSGGRCSITGGYVYRGQEIPTLRGTYFFADFCSSNKYSFVYDGNQVTEFIDRTGELTGVSSIASFGEDDNGEMYMTSLSGGVYQITTLYQLQATNIVGGETGVLRVDGLTPGSFIYFAYSTSGIGETNVPQLGVVAGLRNPVLIGRARANGAGVAILQRQIPAQYSGQEIWLQGAIQGDTTNVVRTVIE